MPGGACRLDAGEGRGAEVRQRQRAAVAAVAARRRGLDDPLGGADIDPRDIEPFENEVPRVRSAMKSFTERPETATLADIVSPGRIVRPSLTGAAGTISYQAE